MIRAERVEQVFEAALDAIGRALGAERSAVLAFDADGVMRFKAQRGLSDEYRARSRATRRGRATRSRPSR